MTDISKPVVTFTIVCDDVRQEVGGKVSLMGLFENIYAPTFPALHPRLAVMTEWSDGKGDFEVSTRICSPDKKTIIRQTVSPLKLNNVQIRHREVSVHLNIEFKTPGIYWVENLLDGEVMHSIPLRVIQLKEQPTH